MGRAVDDPADPGALTPVANPGPGCGLLLLVPEVVTVSLLAPEEVTVSLLVPEVATDSMLAESTPEAAAVGPRGDQAPVGDYDGVSPSFKRPVETERINSFRD